jgi:hypothetical protein
LNWQGEGEFPVSIFICESQARQCLAQANLLNYFKEARVTTQITFVDGLIGIFTGTVSNVPATMVVEGNP